MECLLTFKPLALSYKLCYNDNTNPDINKTVSDLKNLIDVVILANSSKGEDAKPWVYRLKNQ